MGTEIETKSKTKRGGFRKGAGRKPTWNDTRRKTINVPRIMAQRVLAVAHALDSGKTIDLVDESEQAKRLREFIKTERQRMEAVTKERGLSPESMPTWKNVSRLLEKLEEILDN